MKIPLYLPNCKICNSDSFTWINLNDNWVEYKCSCGNDMSGPLDSSVTIGFKGLYRSEYELNKNKDYMLSILFSAFAFEWEISHLYKKWIQIDSLDRGEFLSSEKIEVALTKHQKIYDRIKLTGLLLHPQGFDGYARHDHEIYKTINNSFPSLSIETLIKDFEKNLFWPRNKILHDGMTDYDKNNAIKAYNIAYLGLVVLRSMDKYRRNN